MEHEKERVFEEAGAESGPRSVQGPMELNERVARVLDWVPYTGGQAIACMWAPGHVSNVVPKWMRTVNDTVDFLIQLPDYCNDLNACHEFERTLPEHDPNPSSRPDDHPPR